MKEVGRKALHGLIGSKPWKPVWRPSECFTPELTCTSAGHKAHLFLCCLGGPGWGNQMLLGARIKGLISLCATKSLNMSVEAMCFKTKDFSKNRQE